MALPARSKSVNAQPSLRRTLERLLLGESEKLKQVRYLRIGSVEDLYAEETLKILHEAIILDEMMAKVKPTFRRKNRRPV